MISALMAAPSASLPAGIGDWISGHTPWALAGKAVSGVIFGLWSEIMLGLWQLSLRILQLELWFLGSVANPDVSKTGPLQGVMPISLGISLGIATLMLFTQIMLAVWRRDGGGLVHILYGSAQWALVYVGTWGVCAGIIEAANKLEGTIINIGFNVPNLANLKPEQIMAFPAGQGAAEAMARDFTDATFATMYGIMSLFLFLPAGLLGIGVALTRAGALMILVVTLPISASGLIHEFGARIFWRSARWFIATVLIAPNIALLFAIGVQISAGITQGQGKDILGSFGTAIVSGFIMLMAAYSPVALYRIFGWMEPGTASNAQMRQLMSDAKGGFGGLIGGGGSGGGSGGGGGGDKATKTSGDGRAIGESEADGATGQRFGMVGAAASKVAGSAAGQKVAGAAGAAASKVAGSAAGQKVAGAAGAMAGTKVGQAAAGAVHKVADAAPAIGHALAKGQSMAGSAAAGARNMQADVLGGSGVGDRLDNYAGAPAAGGGGPRATNTIPPLASQDLGANLVHQSQHHGGDFGPQPADMGTAVAGDVAGGAV